MSAILGSPTNPIEHGAPGTKIIRVLVVGPPAQLALFARKLTLALPVVDLMRRAKRGDSTTRANRSSGVGRRMGNRSIRVVGSDVPPSHVRPACRNLPDRVETRPVQRLNNYGHFTERTERTENLHQRPEGRPGGAEG